VADELASRLSTGDDLGASIVVELDGQIVVDLWGGWRDEHHHYTWEHDSLVNVWSITKIATAVAVLHLADTGNIDLHAPVGRYWPEFIANGKENITVAQILSHTSGVAGWERPFTLDALYTWDEASTRLATQTPWWQPGTASGYHAQNYGQLLGEIIRRTSGIPLRDYLAKHITGPLGADFDIGLNPRNHSRAAFLVPPNRTHPTFPPAFDSQLFQKAFTAPPIDAAVAMTASWRAAELGAMNGHGNARSAVRIASVLHPDARQYVRLSQDAISAAFTPASDGTDKVLGLPLRWGLGIAIADERTFPYLPAGVGVWGGWGGSLVVIDRKRHLTVAYVMNKMAPDIIGSPRAKAYIQAVYASLA
jgi:CubicO group peptidase (beta-lactamase class C family)